MANTVLVPEECKRVDERPAEAGRELLEQAKHSPQALSDVYRLYAPRITRYVVRRIGHVPDAEDIVANVFLAMVRHLPSYRPGAAPFSAWLYRVATNEINRFLRKQRLRRIFAPLTNEPPIEEVKADEPKSIRHALLKIPLRFQNALTLHYLEGFSVEEVSSILGVAPGTVKSRLSRGRAMLRSVLCDENGRIP